MMLLFVNLGVSVGDSRTLDVEVGGFKIKQETGSKWRDLGY